MIEKYGDIWNVQADWICITTNGMVKKDGKGVMGAGIAKQAKMRFKNIDLALGKSIKENGNHVSFIHRNNEKWIVSFPTKYDWRDGSDINLIIRSAQELRSFYNRSPEKPTVVLTRPGCGCGNLRWEYVRPVIMGILDVDNFIVVNQ